MPLAGFEPAIPASERPKTHALDGASNGIGRRNMESVGNAPKQMPQHSAVSLNVWDSSFRGPTEVNFHPLVRSSPNCAGVAEAIQPVRKRFIVNSFFLWTRMICAIRWRAMKLILIFSNPISNTISTTEQTKTPHQLHQKPFHYITNIKIRVNDVISRGYWPLHFRGWWLNYFTPNINSLCTHDSYILRIIFN
jgi:hypothetical protein